MADSTLPAVDRGYRRALRMSVAVAVLALIALSASGYPLVGALVAAGFALGAWNSRRISESAVSIAGSGELDRRSLTSSGARRLGYVTFIVLGLAIGLRPTGWTVVLGLAAFQFLLVANTAGPLLREVRQG